jgi:hypothetical protein
MVVTDSPEEAVAVIIDCFEKHCARAQAVSEGANILHAQRRRSRGGMRHAIAPAELKTDRE